jgi:hypothetical protein
VEALRKKERQDETQFTTKIDGFLSFIPPWMLRYFFPGISLNLTLCMTKLRVMVLCFSYFTDNSNVYTCQVWHAISWFYHMQLNTYSCLQPHFRESLVGTKLAFVLVQFEHTSLLMEFQD